VLVRLTTRSIAITVGGLLLAAAVATPVLAQADEEAPAPGMTHMHDQMMGGHSTDMARMHDRMMAEKPDAEPPSESTR